MTDVPVTFDRVYQEFLKHHVSRRRGERLRRLREGHGHAEREFLRLVWWPAFQSLHGLHPEYEVLDFDGRRRYLDFAYLRGDARLALEIDGYGPHLTHIDRWQFADQLRRQNHLVLDGWAVLRFSHDDVKARARQCQQQLLQFMGRQQLEHRLSALPLHERAVLQLAMRSSRPITPRAVAVHLGIGRRATYSLLRRLVADGWLEAASGRERIRSYRLTDRHLWG